VNPSAKLEIKDLWASIDGEMILKGVNLSVPAGEFHAIMGPNGNGKSTLVKVIAGAPEYTVERGEVLHDGENILEMEPDERARKGLYLAFQYPVEIPGVTVANFLRLAIQARTGQEVQFMDFYQKLTRALEILDWDESWVNRYLNQGFSGGEKKRNEILQMLMLEPGFALMDETDSGLDIDALKVVAKGVNAMRGPDFSALMITHYNRLLEFIVPDKVHVMVDGRIVKSGGKELALELEAGGYEPVKALAASQPQPEFAAAD
jgi:Fe-S cluster assembly ATP-binding protein